MKQRGIDKMLDEAREDSKEDDAVNMKRNCECFLWYDMVTTDSSRIHGQTEYGELVLRHMGRQGVWIAYFYHMKISTLSSKNNNTNDCFILRSFTSKVNLLVM